MGKKIVHVELTEDGLDRMIQEIRDYKTWLEEKTSEFILELAKRGVQIASMRYARAQYDGPRDVEVKVEEREKNLVAVVAMGQTVLFLEFGSGILYPDNHPYAAGTGYTHGSWSEGPEGKGHWKDPNGWFYAHGKRSKGNPASMAMYWTISDLENMFADVARKVYK